MIEFIPLHQYATVVYSIMLAFIASLSVMLFAHPKAVLFHPHSKNEVARLWGWGCFILLLLLLGLRPISYEFGDMGTYYKHFLRYQTGHLPDGGDLLFEWTMWLFATFLSAPLFFFFCTVVYLVPVVVAARRMLWQYWPLAFFFSIALFDFYGYGVNGIRQGMAASIFLLAVVSNRKWHAWIWALVAIGLHGSFAVPAALLLLVQYAWNPRYYLVVWLACLLLATIFPSIGTMLADLSLSAGGYDAYLNPDSSFVEQFAAVGFRTDFILYSLLPIGIGGYFLFWRKVKDRFFAQLYCLYVGSNAFWLIMIHTVISNRIAYLSWCLMGFVIAYPLVRFRGMAAQHQVYSALLLLFYLFTFIAHT